MVAGCVYAHKVIVQSEKIRDSYIQAFKKQYGGRFGRPEDKFIALGSPKFDKVVNSRREDYEIPAEWEKLLKNADGTHKKVVFCITEMEVVLENYSKQQENRFLYNRLNPRLFPDFMPMKILFGLWII